MPAPVQPEPSEHAGGPVRLAPGVEVPADALRWSFARSGGPGGQNVNKVNTKAELRVALGALGLRERAALRLKAALGKRLTDEGDVLIVSQSERSQSANKDECLERLRELVLAAMVEPKIRRATRPTRGSKERRLKEKKSRGQIKRGRRGED